MRGGADLEWVAPIGALRCVTPMALSAAIARRVMWPLIASMAPRALNSGLLGSGRCSVYEVNDGTGQEDTAPFIQCLPDNAYEGWAERDKLR